MDKQLLIIGNGFDLYCGLKSRYSDFYNAKIKDKYNDLALRYKKSFEKHHYLGDVQPRDFWHTLLCCYDNPKSYGWCDIERIIKDTLNTIYKEKYIDSAWRACYEFHHNMPDNNQDNKPDNFILAFIEQYLYCYLLSFRKYDDFDNPACPIKEKDNLYSHLFTALNSLERLFCEYLKEETERNKESYALNATNLLIKLTDAGLDPIEDLDAINSSPEFYFSNVNILSFNYTTPFTHIDKNHLGTYNHVHGKLCEKDCQKCSSSTVLFGIDDKGVNLDKDKDFRLFSKTYRTLFADANKISALPKNDNSPLTIKFFGHSLNEADYSYFQSIFDYYSIYDNSNVSLVFYYTPFKLEIKSEIVDSVYKLINQYGLTLNNKDQGQNLMHKLILEKRVKIKEI